MSLQEIQSRLNAPKDQYNSFGKYKYRSLEGILKAVKPLLAEFKYSLIISDKMVEVGGRVYVEATARLFGETGTLLSVCTASAREAETKKGMDDAQITGAASSYARKYCANGLFAIDDTQDADAGQEEKTPAEVKADKKYTEGEKVTIFCDLIDKLTIDNYAAWWGVHEKKVKTLETEGRKKVRSYYDQMAKVYGAGK